MGAFQTTVDELRDADLLLHVCDISSPTLNEQLHVVSSVLAELSLTHIPRLLVLTKSDRIAAAQRNTLAYRLSGIATSALDAASTSGTSRGDRRISVHQHYGPRDVESGQQ